MRTAIAILALLASGGCSDTSSKPPDARARDTRPPDTRAPTDQPRPDGRRDGPLGDRTLAPDRALDAKMKPDLFPGFDFGHPACAGAGGSCTRFRWDICPVGFEPVDPNPHADCGSGWCCAAAPTSTCSSTSSVNCIVGKVCSGCWGPATNTALTCEAGRVCCEDICD